MFSVDFDIDIAAGVSDNIPKRHFLPRDIVLADKRQCLKFDDNGAPIYESTFETKKCRNTRVVSSSRILNNGKLANFSIDTDREITVQTSYLDKQGDLNEQGLCKFRLRDENNTKKVIFSSDLSFCIIVVFIKGNKKLFKKTKAKLELSILTFDAPTNKDMNTCCLHEDLCTLNYEYPFEYFGICFSAYNNNLVVLTYHRCEQSRLDIFKVSNQSLNKQNVYFIQVIKSAYLPKYGYIGSKIKFDQFGKKVMLYSSENNYIYEIENSYHDQFEMFNGSSPCIVYDNNLKSEFLFTTRRDLKQVDIHQITTEYNTEKQISKSVYSLFSKLNLADLNIVFDWISNNFTVHSSSDTLMFIGDHQTLFSFHPFKQQLISTLSMGFRDSSLYNNILKPVNWSGKEISFVYQNKSQRSILKVFSIESTKNLLSLQYLSRMAVLGTYSINMLKGMEIGKSILKILGNSL